MLSNKSTALKKHDPMLFLDTTMRQKVAKSEYVHRRFVSQKFVLGLPQDKHINLASSGSDTFRQNIKFILYGFCSPGAQSVHTLE